MYLIFNDISNQQDAEKFVLLILSKLALHVSADSSAHLQEHFDCICSFLELCCLLPTGDTYWMERQECNVFKPLLE